MAAAGKRPVSYTHLGGTHGILVNFETTNGIEAKDEFVTYGKDIAMQVAAANPGYVDEASVPAEVVAKEKEIMLAQMAGDPKTANKPEAVKQKMIEGKIKKFFKEMCIRDSVSCWFLFLFNVRRSAHGSRHRTPAKRL